MDVILSLEENHQSSLAKVDYIYDSINYCQHRMMLVIRHQPRSYYCVRLVPVIHILA